jgi:Lhr-like helicase
MMDLMLNTKVNFSSVSPNAFEVNKILAKATQVAEVFDKLTPSQKQAIQKACCQRLTLIWGPPGTGKTKTLAMITALMSLHSNKPILVCSF